MRTVTLIVYPDKRILTIGELEKPGEPMHSGYTHEEEEIMRHHRAKIKEYNEAIKNADECLDSVAREILDDQHPNWEKEIVGKTKPVDFVVKNILVSELTTRRREFFDPEVDKEVECVNADPLPGNTKYPKLKEGKVYPLIAVTLDVEGNQHLDVGLESNLEYVSSYETGGHLPNGDTIHWCHPTRFKKVSKN